MDRFREVLLDVWRESCRHIEIHESAGTIAAMLAKHLPLECLVVRRFDNQHQTINTVAVGLPKSGPFQATATTACTPGRWKRLMSWAQDGETLHALERRRSGEIVSIVPPEIEGEILAGPLMGADAPAGVLVIAAPHLKSFG